MKNLFYFLGTLYVSYILLSQPSLVIAEVRCVNGTFISMLHRPQMSPGKESVQHQFYGSLSRLQISIQSFFLLTYLQHQGATCSASYMFINIYSLQAYSLSRELCIGVVESTQFLCSLLTSQSLPLCTRMAPRSLPQHIFLACISSLTCASCRSVLLPWCKLLPRNKTKNIFLWHPPGYLYHPIFLSLCNGSCDSREEDGKSNTMSVHWS